MAFTIPSLDEIHGRLIGDYKARFPGADVSRFSDTWKRLRVLAGAVLGLHYHLNVVYEDLLPDGAAGEKLDRHGDIHDVTRKPATAAKKANALRVTGTPASSVAIGDALVHADGTRYQVDENASIPGGGSYVDVDVLALDTGSATRKQTGETFTFESPPSGINSSAVLVLDMDEDGDDEETDGAYRARILDRIAQPGMGGNANDYATWALEVTGIAGAYVFPLRQGLGSVDLACLHTGSGVVRLLTSGEIAEVQDYIDDRRPVSVADCRVLTVAAEPNDMEILITPEDGAEYQFDWDDTTPLAVSTYTAGTRTLKFTAARPADMQAGHRLIYKRTAATKNDGSEVVIESLGPGADEVVLTTDPANPPQAANAVYAGGPLVEIVRQAVLAHIDALGPARGSYAQGAWDGTLRTASLSKLAQLTPGVLDSTVVVPSANVEATNTAPNPSVGLITAQQVLVRKG